MKKQSKKPLKTTKLVTSSRNTPRLEIQQHFKHSKKIIPNQGIESFPFVLDPEESVKNMTFEPKIRTKKPMSARTAPKSPSPTYYNISDLSNISLDKKVEILNDKISAIEQDIAQSFRSQSTAPEKHPYTPAPSNSYFSEYSLSPPKVDQDPKLSRKFNVLQDYSNSPLAFSDVDQYPTYRSKIDSVRSTQPDFIPMPLFDTNKFDKPVISKDDPSFPLKFEIAEYRKKLKKHVLSDKIERILSEKCKKNISVQYEEPSASEKENFTDFKEEGFGSEESERQLTDANIPAISQEDRSSIIGFSTPRRQNPTSSRTALQELIPPLELDDINILNLGKEIANIPANPTLPINKAEIQKNYKAAFEEIEALTKFLNTAEQKLTNIKSDFQTCLKKDDEENYTTSENEPKSAQVKDVPKPKVTSKKPPNNKTKNFIKLNKANVTKKSPPKNNITTKNVPKKKIPLKIDINTTYDISQSHSIPSSMTNLISDRPKSETTPKEIAIKNPQFSETSTSPINFEMKTLVQEVKPEEIGSMSNLLSERALSGTNSRDILSKTPRLSEKNTSPINFEMKTFVQEIKPNELGSMTNLLSERPKSDTTPKDIVSKTTRLSKKNTSPINFEIKTFVQEVKPIDTINSGSTIAVDFIEIGIQAAEIPALTQKTLIDEALNINLPILTDNKNENLSKNKLLKLSVQKMPQIEIRRPLQKQLAPTLVITPQESLAVQSEIENIKYIQCVAKDTSLSHVDVQEIICKPSTSHTHGKKDLQKNEETQKFHKTEENQKFDKIEDKSDSSEIGGLSIISEETNSNDTSSEKKLLRRSSDDPSIIEKVKRRTFENTKLIKEKRKTITDELNIKTENIPSINTLKAIQTYLETKRVIFDQDVSLKHLTQIPKIKSVTTSPDSSLSFDKKLKEVNKAVTATKAPSSTEIKSCFEKSQLLLEKMKNLTLKSQNVQQIEKSLEPTKNSNDPSIENEILLDSQNQQVNESQKSPTPVNSNVGSEESATKSSTSSKSKSDDETGIDSYSDDFERDYQTGQSSAIKTKENSPRVMEKNYLLEPIVDHSKSSGDTINNSNDKISDQNEEGGNLGLKRVDTIRLSAGDESKTNQTKRSEQNFKPKKDQRESKFTCSAIRSSSPQTFVILKDSALLSQKVVKASPQKIKVKETQTWSPQQSLDDEILINAEGETILKTPYQEISVQTDEMRTNNDDDIVKIVEQTKEMKKELSNLSIFLKKVTHEASAQTDNSQNENIEKSKTGKKTNQDDTVEIEIDSKHVTFSYLPSDGSSYDSQSINKEENPRKTLQETKNESIICSPECTGGKEVKLNSTLEETKYLNLPGTSRETLTSSPECNPDYDTLRLYENTHYDKTIPIYNLYVNPSYSRPCPKLIERTSPKRARTPTLSSSISDTIADPIDTSLSEGEIMLPCKCSTSIGETHLCKYASSIKNKLNKSAKFYPNKILSDSLGIKNLDVHKQRRNLYTDNFVTYTYGFVRRYETSESEPISSGSEYNSSSK